MNFCQSVSLLLTRPAWLSLVPSSFLTSPVINPSSCIDGHHLWLWCMNYSSTFALREWCHVKGLGSSFFPACPTSSGQCVTQQLHRNSWCEIPHGLIEILKHLELPDTHVHLGPQSSRWVSSIPRAQVCVKVGTVLWEGHKVSFRTPSWGWCWTMTGCHNLGLVFSMLDCSGLCLKVFLGKECNWNGFPTSK